MLHISTPQIAGMSSVVDVTIVWRARSPETERKKRGALRLIFQRSRALAARIVNIRSSLWEQSPNGSYHRHSGENDSAKRSSRSFTEKLVTTVGSRYHCTSDSEDSSGYSCRNSLQKARNPSASSHASSSPLRFENVQRPPAEGSCSSLRRLRDAAARIAGIQIPEASVPGT